MFSDTGRLIFQGFKFGMLLQLAVGPVCLFIFNLGLSDGFINAELAVFAVTLVDTLYIIFAILGLTSFISKENVRNKIRYFGFTVVFLFGLNTLLSAFQAGFLNLNISIDASRLNNPFLKGIIFTSANPLTILFWAGVFSSKLAERKSKTDSYMFGFGAILSTLLFLSFVALLSSFVMTFFPEKILSVLNILVGIALMIFAVMILRKK